MRITFLSPPANLSGGERVVSTYAKKLAARGHEVRVICCRPDEPSWSRCIKDVLKGRGWPQRQPDSGSHYENDGIDYEVVKHEGPILEADAPPSDVVIATFWRTAEWLGEFRAANLAKVYFVQGDEAGVLDYEPLARRVRATWTLPFYKIVVSDWLMDLPGFRDSPAAACVQNSVDMKLFSAPRRSKQVLPTVGFMYSQGAFKGSDIAVEAIHLLQKRFAQLKVNILGQSPESAALPLPPGCDFRVHPPQQELAELYARCDCWIFSSRYEGFGLPILEAMASRTPVAATAAGAAPEILGKGGGRLVPIEDAKALATATAEILQMSETAWQDLSNRAYEIASNYTWDDATDRFEAALTAAVAGEWNTYVISLQ